MHDLIMRIGYAVWSFFASINGANLASALSIVGVGMLGIFIVTCVIILAVTVLNKVFSK